MYSVMLVDDMDISRRQIKRMNLWNGETEFRIDAEARNGEDALDILRNRRIDLLITDIKMPKIDGIELLKEVAENGLCPCVVLLSDYEDFEFARHGIQYGAFDYLSKPVCCDDMTILLERAAQFLRRKKKESEFVRNLQMKLEEKLAAHLPEAGFDQLIEAFKSKSRDIMKIAARFADTVTAMYGGDMLMTGTAFKKTVAELMKQLADHYRWLDKFIDVQEYREIDFAGMGGAGEAAAAMREVIEKLFDKILALEYGKDESQIENRISRYVLESVDGKVSIEGISRALYMNRRYLSEVFRRKTGELLIEYITRVKMERAARLLDKSGLKTYEVALLMGYKDTEYFSRIFKKHTGKCPTEYRNTVGVDT